MRFPFPPSGERSAGCLNETELAAYADGTSTRRTEAEAHLARCATCRRSLSVLLRSESLPLRAVPASWTARVQHLGEQKRQTSPRLQWALAAGLACAAVAVAAWFAVPRTPPEIATATLQSTTPQPELGPDQKDRERNVARPAAAPIVILPAEGAAIAGDLEVRWQKLPSAVSYEVRVLNEGGDTIWHTQTSSDRLRIAPDDMLRPGDKYFVLISANLASGKTVRATAVPFRMEKRVNP